MKKKIRSRGDVLDVQSNELHRPHAEVHIPNQSQGHGEIYVPTHHEVMVDSGGSGCYHGVPVPRVG